MGSVEINILGQKYTVKGDADEEHVKRLAAYVADKLKEIHAANPSITPLKASILASPQHSRRTAQNQGRS